VQTIGFREAVAVPFLVLGIIKRIPFQIPCFPFRFRWKWISRHTKIVEESEWIESFLSGRLKPVSEMHCTTESGWLLHSQWHCIRLQFSVHAGKKSAVSSPTCCCQLLLSVNSKFRNVPYWYSALYSSVNVLADHMTQMKQADWMPLHAGTREWSECDPLDRVWFGGGGGQPLVPLYHLIMWYFSHVTCIP